MIAASELSCDEREGRTGKWLDDFLQLRGYNLLSRSPDQRDCVLGTSKGLHCGAQIRSTKVERDRLTFLSSFDLSPTRSLKNLRHHTTQALYHVSRYLCIEGIDRRKRGTPFQGRNSKRSNESQEGIDCRSAERRSCKAGFAQQTEPELRRTNFRKPEIDAIIKHEAEVSRLQEELAKLESQLGHAGTHDGEERDARSALTSPPPASSVSVYGDDLTAAASKLAP
jgi:hypothetical protein